MTDGLTRNDIPATSGDIETVRKMLENVNFATSYRASGDIASLRAATATMISNPFFRPEPEGLTVTPGEVGGCPGEWIAGEGASDVVLVFFHGGGYIRGSLDLGRANAKEIALGTGCTVFAVAYRQAPEDPFPAAFDDAVTVAKALGAEGRRFALVGESAGGGLVLAAAAALRDEGAPPPLVVTCISPFVDLTLSGESWDFNAGKDIATRAMGSDMIAIYMGAAPRDDPRASPIYGDLSGLPPVHIIVGSVEGLLSEAMTAAEKASSGGAKVTLDVFEGMPHGFTKYRFDAANEAMVRVSAHLRKIVHAEATV
ncbi:alpha/beta hydrolase [Maritimibacter dapengensis]|uniref:Alpha/beta hydrolase n=1 Tax=Maritimibacter dapengensis TaxID=2836868 RepID=A0ABS6T6B7_9RHOB|nr:alpha/beta hydrolase [Maritimibacter dapengensis]MBV7380811.1 alpha/beta hydrolase [Maritimibacter dapengensis]